MSYQRFKFAPLRAPPAGPPSFGGHEPLLADVLADPIVLRLMVRDRVELATLMTLIGDAQMRLQ